VSGVLGRVARHVQLNQLALYIKRPFCFVDLSRFGLGFIVLFMNMIQVAHEFVAVVCSKIVIIEPASLVDRFFRVGIYSVPFLLIICIYLLHRVDFKERRGAPARIGLLHRQFFVGL